MIENRKKQLTKEMPNLLLRRWLHPPTCLDYNVEAREDSVKLNQLLKDRIILVRTFTIPVGSERIQMSGAIPAR